MQNYDSCQTIQDKPMYKQTTSQSYPALLLFVKQMDGNARIKVFDFCYSMNIPRFTITSPVTVTVSSQAPVYYRYTEAWLAMMLELLQY